MDAAVATANCELRTAKKAPRVFRSSQFVVRSHSLCHTLQQDTKPLHIRYARNVVEHDVALPARREPPEYLLELLIGVRCVVALVPMQPPIRELRRERRANEWVDRVNEVEIPAEVEHDFVCPGAARLPEIAHAILAADGGEELPHGRDVLRRLTEARRTLKENPRRAKDARGLDRRLP